MWRGARCTVSCKNPTAKRDDDLILITPLVLPDAEHIYKELISSYFHFASLELFGFHWKTLNVFN